MKNARSQCCISFSHQEGIPEVFLGTSPSRSNDRDGKRIGQQSQGIIGITCPDAIMIHAGEKYFTCPTLLRFMSPRE